MTILLLHLSLLWTTTTISLQFMVEWRVYLTTPHFNNFNVHEVLKWSFSKYLLFTFSGPSSLYKVSGLLPKTFYHFRARARNLAGYSDHSNMIYLQTSATHAVGELLGSATTASKASVPTVITIQTLLLCSILSLIRWRSSTMYIEEPDWISCVKITQPMPS